MVKSVLVVAAHPDDEVLGCGATMARHVAEGARVTVLLMADGVGAREPADRAEELAARQAAARRACGELGVTEMTLLPYPDNRMDQVALLQIVQDIEKVIRACQPDTVYTHHAGDVNIDHRRVHDAVVAACRPQPGDRGQRGRRAVDADPVEPLARQQQLQGIAYRRIVIDDQDRCGCWWRLTALSDLAF